MKRPPSIFFSCPPLSPQEETRLRAEANETAVDVIARSRLHGGPIHWTPHGTEANVKIFKGYDVRHRHRDAALETEIYLGLIEVKAHMEEIAAVFADQNGADAIDMAHLYTIEERTHRGTSVHVSWRGYKSFLPGVIRRRDVCLVDIADGFVTKDGRRGFVSAQRSVELPCCPELDPSLGYTRQVTLGSGLVALESSQRGTLYISYLLQLPGAYSGLAEHIVQAFKQDIVLKDKTARRRLLDALLPIRQRLFEAHLSRTPILNAMQLVPHEARYQCYLCLKPFGLFRRKTSCFKCGEVFCSKCTEPWRVQVGDRLRLVPICKFCVQAPSDVDVDDQLDQECSELEWAGASLETLVCF
ncbi:hypothetical protein LEN26_012122 [Aphanomyces euteiches]|nr:hypothetical protein AeMF1_012707 [Aphanomyces euteiches]KAH9118406.1 hypothetical protein LEN26_012122 [Aphanomyces euteiches]KAH9184637.1 hypothetical protein AeNC1_013384 [Aphanomyces euteiches]